MADDTGGHGPVPTGSSYFSTAATSLQKSSHASSSRPNVQNSSRPQNQPGFDRQTASSDSSAKTGVVQPKPQALPRRTGPSSIIVSPRQKGNPVLEKIKQMPWEYGDIPADYVLGLTTCALFLSLKYHRLHPEYIYGRIKALQGKYRLRIVLCMVDIQSHEATIKELSKTSIINNVTIVLCWSAAEGARYLELFKTYENAQPTAIKQHQSNTYSDRMIDFVTTPRAINKTDAVSLVSQFGSIRRAINAPQEEVAMIAGWGEKKVQQWCSSVREPFRIKRAGKRTIALENLVASQPVSRAPTLSRDVTRAESGTPAALSRQATRADSNVPVNDTQKNDEFEDDDEVMAQAIAASLETEKRPSNAPQVESSSAAKRRKMDDDDLGEGVMAALNKLRKPES